MNRLLILMMAGALACAGSAMAADAPAANSQQDKMKACNAQAGDKKGDERKAFMKNCLSAKPVKAESRMAICNKKTAGLPKEERAKAQSECMKAPA
ncbi:MAG: phosphate starvation-inducible protein PsiF [Burkholderiales bacterium]|nr:phosphate starvation-inducible protein PsiF [Burkholderiales bacterium]